MATKERKCIRMKISDRELSINHLYRVPEDITEDRARAYVVRGCAEWTEPPKGAIAPDPEPEETAVKSLETEKASLLAKVKEQSAKITRLRIEVVSLRSELAAKPEPLAALPEIPEKPDSMRKAELVALVTQIRETAAITPKTEKRG